VQAQMPESKLIEGVPRVVKIASRDVIDTVIGSALPGVVLTHANPPPAPIPARVGFRYFMLDYDWTVLERRKRLESCRRLRAERNP
jgi:predicted component of type VI protein secretion system